MVKPRFIHLHVHSDYSMIDGIAKVKSLVKKAAKLGMPALAITDFTNLCGLIKFYIAAHNEGIKPIVGADFNVYNEFFGKETRTQLTILAMNNIGYNNLTLLISKSYKQGYGITGPWIDRKWLAELNEGLILIVGRTGDIGKNLLNGSRALLEQCIAFYKQYFLNRFYLEFIRTGRSNEENYLRAAADLAERCNLPVVATNDVRFIDSSDFDAHEVRVAIHDGFILNDPKRPHNYSPQQYMRSEEEMCKLFIDIPEALENSVEIAKRCNVTILMGKYFLPKFPTGDITTKDFLIMKSKEGLEKRLKAIFPDKNECNKRRTEYHERLNIELQTINRMGLSDYFLIVMEFIQWSKGNGIPVGPGRGSGAGSLVAYALKITDLNPIEFDLIFERFLNPERISMPDFDIDFCMEKRDLVINHMADTYGRDAVSQIITFGTMAAKAATRDVGRVFGYSYGFVNQISKLIPSYPGITLEKAFEAEPQLSKIYETNKDVRVIIDMARKLEGVIRNAGKHAGGIVIAPTKITDFTPLYCNESGQHPVTQFDKNDVERIGLVKFDFLGLRTLTIINWTLDMINKRLKINGKPLLDISTIPLNDKKSFEVLQWSKTTAIFQLESRGMKDLIKRLKPDCFEDMIALVALFRPGPLNSGMVDNFINRKHGREKISYPDVQWQHESLKPVLESTYGIILYQEQVMKIAQILAGYTLSDADILRLAIGKKKPDEMSEQRSLFEKGAKKNGIDSKLAMKIFDLVEKFAGYGFNKSHSAAYALVSYQTLWLKTHYPAEFMAAALSADIDNAKKIVELIDECWCMGLTIIPPDINLSLYHFYVNDNGDIVYGMGAIKGIGKNQAEAIIKARNNGGSFKGIFDLCTRVENNKLNRRTLEKLIMSGTLDKLGQHRSVMMSLLDHTLKATSQHIKDRNTGQTDMFDILTEKQKKQTKSFHINYLSLSEREILDKEKEVLGLYLTGHPLNQYLKEIEYYVGNYRLKDINPTEHSNFTKVAGLVINVKIIVTNGGKRIGICTLNDSSGSLEVVLFTDILNKYQKLLEKNRILIISGQIKFNYLNNKIKMIANEIMDIEEARKKYVRGLIISLTDIQINEQFLNKLSQCLKPYCFGNIPVYIYYQRNNACALLYFGKKWHVSPNDRLLHSLRNLVGFEQVKLEFD